MRTVDSTVFLSSHHVSILLKGDSQTKSLVNWGIPTSGGGEKIFVFNAGLCDIM